LDFISGQFQSGVAIVYLHKGLRDLWSLSICPFFSGQLQSGVAIVYLHKGLRDLCSLSIFSTQKRTQNFRNMSPFVSCGEMVGKRLLIWGQIDLFS
jgi:hypothetical protein